MQIRITVPCPQCRRDLKIRREYFGQEVVCSHCQHAFTPPDRVVVRCPDCGEDGTVPVGLLGGWVRCGRCAHPFEADEIEGGPRLRSARPAEIFDELRPIDVGELVTQAEATRAELRSFGETFHRISAERVEADARHANLDAQLKALREEHDAALLELEGLRSQALQVGRLEAEVRAARDEADTLRSALDAAESRIAAAETLGADRERLAAEVDEVRSLAATKIDEAYRLHVEERAGLEADLAALRGEQEANLAGRGAEVARLRDEFATLSAELADSRRELEEARHRWDDERKSLAEAADLERSRALAEHEGALAVASAEASELRAELQGRLEVETAAIRAESDRALADSEGRAAADREALEGRLRDLEGKASRDALAAETEAARLLAEVESLHQERDLALRDLAARLDASEAERRDAERHHADAIGELMRDRDGARDELARRDAEHSEASSRLDEAWKALAVARAEHEAVRQQGQGIPREEVEALRAERDALRTRQGDQARMMQHARADLERRLTEAQADLRASAYHADSLEAELHEAREQLENDRLPLLRTDWGAAGSPVSEADRAHAEDLARQLARSQHELARLREMFSGMGIRID